MSRVKSLSILAAVCVAGWALPVIAKDAPAKVGPAAAGAAAARAAAGLAAADNLEGRWRGTFHGAARRSHGAVACSGDDCHKLTLDIARCGDGWCGVEVDRSGSCKAVALRLAPKGPEPGEGAFAGQLELAASTEPYTVRATYRGRDEDSAPILWLIGDTGGQFRVFRRSFPFEAQLERVDAARCENKTS